MRRSAAVCMAVAWSAAASAQTERTRFWNLTGETITHLYLSPAGKNTFGPDQCQNDRDGTVDHDERLRITGVTSGRYDIRFQDKRGRDCLVQNVEVKSGDIFAIEERELAHCRR
jgi:hypothetical protein